MVVETPIPAITRDDDVLIQVKTSGICGSDISIYQGTSPVATCPHIIGHEFSGPVKETGVGVYLYGGISPTYFHSPRSKRD